MTLHVAGREPAHRIAVVTAGLSEPSSTRLLADLLGEATASALRWRDGRGRRAAPAGPRDHRRPADRLPQRRPGAGDRDRHRRRRGDRGDPGVQRFVLRPVQVVLRRPRERRARRHPGAGRRDGRHGPPLARARARPASAVQLPARGRRAHRRLRRERGLGRHRRRRCPAPPHRPRGRRARRPRRSPARSPPAATSSTATSRRWGASRTCWGADLPRNESGRAGR